MKLYISIIGILLSFVSFCQDTGFDSFPIIELHSGPYENGYHHGLSFQSEIIELHDLWKENLEATYGYDAEDVIQDFLDSTDYISAMNRWTPELLDEIRGISDGSGIDFNTTLAFQLVDEMWSSGHIIAKPHHCSSLGFNNFIVDGSTNFIAQNIDIPVFYHGFEVLLDIHDTITGDRKLVSTFAGFIGANGLNNKLGVCVNALLDLKSSTKGLPVCCVVRGILEQKTFEEAENFIRSIEHASGQNYIIGSRKKAVSFECALEVVTEFWPDTTKAYTYHTNQAYANYSFKDSYVNRIKEQFQADPGDIHLGCPRFEMIEEVIHNTDSFTLSIIKGILPVSPVYNRYTWLSTIMEFNDQSNTLHISSREKLPGTYYKFEVMK